MQVPPSPNSKACLAALPVEIIEHILTDIPLRDLRSLRLASREVKGKVSGGRFKTFCTHKEADLRPHALHELSARLNPHSIESNLQDLTITGLVYVTKTQENILRLGTVPADPTDIFGQRRDALGNDTALRPRRNAASDEDLKQAAHELKLLKQWQDEASLERSSGQNLQALAALLTRIAEVCTLKRLRSIKLNVAVVRYVGRRFEPKDGGAWRPIWETATHLFAVTLQALAQTGHKVDSLDAYGNVGVCSVPGFDIARTLGRFADDEQTYNNLRATLGGLKALSLSMSNRVVPALGFLATQEADPDDEVWEQRRQASIQYRALKQQRIRDIASLPSTQSVLPPLQPCQIVSVSESDKDTLAARVANPRNLTGMALLLNCAPNLQELDLHHYYVPWYDARGFSLPGYSQGVFDNIARMACLPKLQKLTLRGLSPGAGDLLAFLRTSQATLQSVDFRSMTLYAGNWKTIFSHLTAAENNLTYLHFDVLFEEGADGRSSYVSFPGARCSWIPCANGAAALTVEGRDIVLQEIEYSLREQWVVGCVEHSMWRHERRRGYGPPGFL